MRRRVLVGSAVAAAIAALALAQGGPPAAQFGGDGVLDVRDYGAVCDGVTDDAAAIQAAIDAARLVKPNGTVTTHGIKVRLPAGECKIGASLLVRDMWGFTLEGQGMRASALIWSRDADPNQAAVRVYDCRNCRFADFGVRASSATGTGIELDTAFLVATDATYGSTISSQNRWDRVEVNGTAGAIRVGFAFVDGPGSYPANDANNERHTIRHSRITNFEDRGIQIGGAHPLSPNAGGGNFRGIAVADTECGCSGKGESCAWLWSGSLLWERGGTSACLDADFKVMGNSGPVTIRDTDSENSGRFLYVDGMSGNPRAVSVEDTRAVASSANYNTDGCWLFLGGRGPYRIAGGEMGGMALPVGICHAPGGDANKGPAVVVTGLLWDTTLDDPWRPAWCNGNTYCQDPAHAAGMFRRKNTQTQPHPFP